MARTSLEPKTLPIPMLGKVCIEFLLTIHARRGCMDLQIFLRKGSVGSYRPILSMRPVGSGPASTVSLL